MTEYSKTAKCAYCGKEFEKNSKHHVYCSGRCKEAFRLAKLELHEGVCMGCGAKITYKIKAGKPTKRYCSVACSLTHNVPVKTLTCVDCGAVFEFRGRTTKLRCALCWHKHRSKTTMAARAAKDASVQLGAGSGGAQNNDSPLTTEERAALNATRRAYYAANRDRLRSIARSRYRARALASATNCAVCGYCRHPEALIVHHKDMNRENNSDDNLVVLCSNCHAVLHKLIRKEQRANNVTAVTVYTKFIEAEEKSRNEAGNPDRATRTEGCEESQSGATHTGTSRTDMSRHEAATEIISEKIC